MGGDDDVFIDRKLPAKCTRMSLKINQLREKI